MPVNLVLTQYISLLKGNWCLLLYGDSEPIFNCQFLFLKGDLTGTGKLSSGEATFSIACRSKEKQQAVFFQTGMFQVTELGIKQRNTTFDIVRPFKIIAFR
jgi:hypothetical protein